MILGPGTSPITVGILFLCFKSNATVHIETGPGGRSSQFGFVFKGFHAGSQGLNTGCEFNLEFVGGCFRARPPGHQAPSILWLLERFSILVVSLDLRH